MRLLFFGASIILGACLANHDKFAAFEHETGSKHDVSLLKEYLVERWSEFKQKHGVFYPQRSDENEAFARFSTKLEQIEKHNKLYEAALVSYKLSADYPWLVWTDEEFRQRRLGLKIFEQTSESPLYKARNITLPIAFDWRQENAQCMTPVRDQGHCGSCYIFSATGSLEMTSCIRGNNSNAQSISAQMFLDCVGLDYHASGCNGGSPEHLIKYSHDNRRADSWQSYSYHSEVEKCKLPQSSAVAIPKTAVVVQPGSEPALLEALVENGPISVGLCGTDDSFMAYSGGLYDNPNACSELNHAVVLVGYTEHALIIKNSWNVSWGEQGYMHLARGVTAQRIGIFKASTFPTV